RDLGPDAVQADRLVRARALDLSLAFQFHAELGEERDGGVQVVDDDGDVVHPLNGHVSQHRTAASRHSGAEGTDGLGTDLARARIDVTAWRDQHPAVTSDELVDTYRSTASTARLSTST